MLFEVLFSKVEQGILSDLPVLIVYPKAIRFAAPNLIIAQSIARGLISVMVADGFILVGAVRPGDIRYLKVEALRDATCGTPNPEWAGEETYSSNYITHRRLFVDAKGFSEEERKLFSWFFDD